jgi:hypothetical protein
VTKNEVTKNEVTKNEVTKNEVSITLKKCKTNKCFLTAIKFWPITRLSEDRNLPSAYAGVAQRKSNVKMKTV